jgi:lysozyme family protein
LKKITDEEWWEIFKKGFYDKIKGDSIVNDSICLLVVDFAFNSGVRTAIKNVQKALGCVADGIIGKKTLAALNAEDAEDVFQNIWGQRYWYYWTIAHNNPKNQKFLKGWLHRLEDFTYNEN